MTTDKLLSNNNNTQFSTSDAMESEDTIIQRALKLIELDASKAKSVVINAISMYPENYQSWLAAFNLHIALHSQWVEEIIAHVKRPYITYGNLAEHAIHLVPQNHRTGFDREEMFVFFGIYWGQSTGWNRWSSGEWKISSYNESPDSEADIIREIDNAIRLSPDSEKSRLISVKNAWTCEAKQLMDQYLKENPKPYCLGIMDRLIGS